MELGQKVERYLRFCKEFFHMAWNLKRVWFNYHYSLLFCTYIPDTTNYRCMIENHTNHFFPFLVHTILVRMAWWTLSCSWLRENAGWRMNWGRRFIIGGSLSIQGVALISGVMTRIVTTSSVSFSALGLTDVICFHYPDLLSGIFRFLGFLDTWRRDKERAESSKGAWVPHDVLERFMGNVSVFGKWVWWTWDRGNHDRHEMFSEWSYAGPVSGISWGLWVESLFWISVAVAYSYQGYDILRMATFCSAPFPDTWVWIPSILLTWLLLNLDINPCFRQEAKNSSKNTSRGWSTLFPWYISLLWEKWE